MREHWERLAEAQRIKQQIEAEFRLALAQIGRDAAGRVRRAAEEEQSRLPLRAGRA